MWRTRHVIGWFTVGFLIGNIFAVSVAMPAIDNAYAQTPNETPAIGTCEDNARFPNFDYRTPDYGLIPCAVYAATATADALPPAPTAIPTPFRATPQSHMPIILREARAPSAIISAQTAVPQGGSDE